MAGLFSRVDDLGPIGDGSRRINAGLLADMVISLASVNRPFVGTLAQNKITLRDILNLELDKNEAGDALTAAEEAHIEQVIDHIEGLSNNTQKLIYAVGSLRPTLNLAELGRIAEVDFNFNLNIV